MVNQVTPVGLSFFNVHKTNTFSFPFQKTCDKHCSHAHFTDTLKQIDTNETMFHSNISFTQPSRKSNKYDIIHHEQRMINQYNPQLTQPDFTNGTTWYVDMKGADFKTIQEAINAAQNGDTIIVHEGVYYEHLLINKAITLKGENKEKTIIDAGNNRDVIVILSDWVSIHNFTICHGWDGIDIRYASQVTITSNIITHNEDGIDLRDDATNITLTHNTISYNDYYGIGIQDARCIFISENTIEQNNWDGINIQYSSFNSIQNNAINNSGEHGIYLYASTHTTIQNTFFENNGISIRGSVLSHWNTHKITQNRVNTKPIYYYKNQTNKNVPVDAGQIIIANCSHILMNQLTISNASTGVQVAFSSHNIIQDCTIIQNNNLGIYLKESSENTIMNTIISNNSYEGLILDGSTQNTVEYNQINYNGFYAVRISYSPMNSFYHNLINANLYGIYLSYSPNNTFVSNEFITNGIYGGLCLNYFSNHMTIRKNTFTSNGLLVINSYYNEITENQVNQKPLVYLENQTDQKIEYAGQVILINCENITVQHCNISAATLGIELWNTKKSLIAYNQIAFNTNEAILLLNSNANTIIANTITQNNIGIINWQSHSNLFSHNKILTNYKDGIVLTYSNSCSITNNEIAENEEVGIFMDNSSNSIIKDNKVSDCNHGIYLKQQSKKNQIINNNCSDNSVDGIGVTSNSSQNKIISNTCMTNLKGLSIRDSFDCFIENNLLTTNQQAILLNNVKYTSILCNTCHHNAVGIYLYLSSYNNILNNDLKLNNHKGIILREQSDENIIKQNQIGPNNYQGIYIERSQSNIISYNNITLNNDDGIGLIQTGNNNIHHNNIYDNTDYGIQGMLCFDSARFNYWGSIFGPIPYKDILVLGKIVKRPCLHQPVDITT